MLQGNRAPQGPATSRLVVAAIGVILLSGPAAAEVLYYTTGNAVRTWNASTGVHATVSTNAVTLGSLAFDLSGALYSLVPGDSSIARLAPDGSWSTIVSGLGQPECLTVYGDLLYVKRFPTGGITRVDQSGNLVDVATLPEYISGLTCDDNGNIYASGQTKVFKVAPNGAFSAIADLAPIAGANQLLTGITRSQNGLMYLTSQNMNNPGWGNGAVWSLNTDGGIQFFGGHPDRLYGARQVAASASGQVFVLHTWSPFVGSSQLSGVPNGVSVGYSGFQVGGLAFQSAAVPEPGGVTLLALGVSALWFGAYLKRRSRIGCRGSSPASGRPLPG